MLKRLHRFLCGSLRFHSALFAVSFYFLLTTKLDAQDINYAHYIINTLTSKEFAGRGYVNGGNKKAADFFAHQFDSLHLQSFNKNYFQNFFYDVNTFPSEISLNADDKELVTGKDFIVEAISGSGKGAYEVTHVKNFPFNKDSLTKFFSQNFSGKVLSIEIDSAGNEDKKIIQTLKSEDFLGKHPPAAIIIAEEKKLTMDVSQTSVPYPVFTALKKSLPDGFKSVSFNIKNKLLKNFDTQNEIAYVKGTTHPDSFIVVTAHYDHLGMMGRDVYFPGANDNASGDALMLNLAEYYSLKENQPKYSIAFIAFSGEEAGLIGSKYYTEHPLFPLSQIKFLINLDLLGTGEEGMMVVNATEYPQQFHLLDSINTTKSYLVKIGQRGKAMNSDHYFFTEKGVPSFFFYTMGGIQAYHDIYDKAETLPLTEFEDVFRLIVDFEKAITN